MIDKIHISFPNKFKISDKARFKRIPSTIDEGTGEIIYPNDGLYITDEDRVVEGQKAFMHNDYFHITITPTYKNILLNLTKVSQFGINLRPIDYKEALNSFQLIQDSLEENGIYLDLRECELKRIEIFKNLYPTKPFRDYVKALDYLEIKRGFNRKYGQSYYFENDSRKLSFYDKTKELIDSKEIKPETGNIIGPCIRAEYRLFNKIVIKRELQLTTLGDLLDNWDDLKNRYNKSVASFLQPYEKKLPRADVTFKNEADILKYFFDTYGTRSGWNKYRKYLGSTTMTKNWTKYKDLREVISEYKSSDAVSRHIKDLRADAMELPLSPDVSPLGLLQEFKSMLLS